MGLSAPGGRCRIGCRAPDSDFELRCVERASPFDFGGGMNLTTCGAEDLVIMKVFADRGQDWVDVEAVVLRRGGELDWPLIERELKPLLEVRGGTPSWERLAGLRAAGERVVVRKIVD